MCLFAASRLYYISPLNAKEKFDLRGGVLTGGGAVMMARKDVELSSSRIVGSDEGDHFLSYGYGSDALVVLFGGDTFFRPSKDGANVVTFAADGGLTVAGFVWPDNTEELLRGTAYLIDEPVGGGHVILFADDPNFRHLWRTSTQLFFNSILLAPSLR